MTQKQADDRNDGCKLKRGAKVTQPAMIVECLHCRGRMRVDEASIPPGKWVKVRCPHCNGVGFSGTAPQAGSVDAPAPNSQPHPARVNARPDNGFRFPAEGTGGAERRARFSFAMRLLIFTGVSLAVIAVFALIVNLVLPGPAG